MQLKPLVLRLLDDTSDEDDEEEIMQLKPILRRNQEEMSVEDEEEEILQPKPILRRNQEKMSVEDEEEEILQPKPILRRSNKVDTEDLENKLNNSKGGGSPLPDETKGFMESRFGADFSDVRVHTDSTAFDMSRSISAQAFTQGKDIYFNSGKYSPDSNEGKSLLAHELTHVVQQKGDEISQIQKQEKAEDKSKKGNSLLDFLDYVWRTVIGEWNNEQEDPFQTLVNTVGGFIPVVDQVLDLRDFSAQLYYMVFKKDYKDPMRWLSLGLTAIGAIPFVGSLVKGLGKLALSSDAAKAVGKYAEPLLEQIKQINPEWADIGKLKAAIDENWEAGVAASKQAWMDLLAGVKGKVSKIPLLPSWFWGASKLKSAKLELLETISEIQNLSHTMLDEALDKIKSEIDIILKELDRIAKETLGQPELVPEGVTSNKILISDPQYNRPLEMRGREGGRRNLQDHEGEQTIRADGSPGRGFGHTIANHVGKSEKWLQDRLLRSGPDVEMTSSFYNMSAANRSVGRFIKQNRSAIETWLKNGKSARFAGRIDLNKPIGIVVKPGKQPGATTTVVATNVEVVIVRSASKQGWHILTAFPTYK